MAFSREYSGESCHEACEFPATAPSALQADQSARGQIFPDLPYTSAEQSLNKVKRGIPGRA